MGNAGDKAEPRAQQGPWEQSGYELLSAVLWNAVYKLWKDLLSGKHNRKS